MNVSRVHFHRFNFCAIFEVIVRRVHLPSPTRRQSLPDCTQESVVNFFRLAQRSVPSTPRRLSHSTLRRWDLAWSGRVSSSLTLARMPALPVMTLFCPSLPLPARPGAHSHTLSVSASVGPSLAMCGSLTGVGLGCAASGLARGWRKMCSRL